jgi:hypothetical protein
MKSLLFTFLLLFVSSRLWAQDDITKDDIKIRVTYFDMNEHDFLIDVDIIKTTATVTYISYDSIRFENVRKDFQYQAINKRRLAYKNGDPKVRLTEDSISKIYEKHRIYTRDSKKINLNKDTTYRNLIKRILTSSKDELSPDINANAKITKTYIVTSGSGNFNLVIVTPTSKRSIPAHLPQLETEPLLFNFLKSSLGKKPNSSTVKNILKNYPGYK